MKTICVENQQVDIYDIHDFPYDKIDFSSTVENKKERYANVVATFDIETTTIKESECKFFKRDFGFMYIWQFYIEGYCCMGRYWDEYVEFIEKLTTRLFGKRLVIWVHNLPFEFQFMRNYFKWSEVFAMDRREVVRAVSGYCEYRCSYKLTNMGLEKFLQKTKGVTFIKQSGKKFNYRKKRFATTELTEDELGYCFCDVAGLFQGIKTLLEDDDLCSIPMTSTGYVRREFRERCLENPAYKQHMRKIALDSITYTLCREASRGAIAGSNHLHTNRTIPEVDSFDIKSSYPYQMATKYYPQSRFIRYQAKYGTEKFETLLNTMCCIIVWECKDLRLKHWESIPYISKAKCRAVEGCRTANGKVYLSKRIGMCCTELDFQIIREHYRFDPDSVVIHELWCAQRGMLAKPFREYLMYMFQQKTNLEDGDPYLYAKYKNKINASFGMMLTDILNPTIEFNNKGTKVDEVWTKEEIVDIDKELLSYYKNRGSFLSYQHGVWVLAHGRDDLVKGMNIVGDDIVQVDTDSVKACDDYTEEFELLNQKIIDNAENFDVKPYSIKNGEKHYLGVWEHEGREGCVTYEEFRTLGAKKYAVVEDNKITTTVSGLSKSAGKWFDTNGGLDSFKPGTIVPCEESGRTSSIYNDLVEPVTIVCCGELVNLGSNIAINDVEYTLGITSEWLLMILDGEASSDAMLVSDGAFKGW